MNTSDLHPGKVLAVIIHLYTCEPTFKVTYLFVKQLARSGNAVSERDRAMGEGVT